MVLERSNNELGLTVGTVEEERVKEYTFDIRLRQLKLEIYRDLR